MYLKVNTKFQLALTIATLWGIFSIWAAQFWFADLSAIIGWFLAGFLILFIAVVPGFINAFMVFSLMMDKRPVRKHLDSYPPITILIAAYNEEAVIPDTFESIAKQNYPGTLEVILIDDGSKDQTHAVCNQLISKYPWLRCIQLETNQGKSEALNRALTLASHELIITLDADSYLYKDALVRIVERFHSDPANTCAVAGTIMVRNSRQNWITQSQEWDYFQGIATVKRVQSLNQGTLVAQGAFSLYKKSIVLELGGWPKTVGEDIVLTWAMLEKDYRVGYCEDAIAFTIVPSTVSGFVRQRQRWARGMIEAFKYHPKVLFRKRLSTFFIWWDLLFPAMDVAFTFGFLPGLVLAMFGYYWIVGPMTLILLPMALLMNSLMYRIEEKMFVEQHLHVRRNTLGFFLYMLPYSCILQPAAVWGYITEIFGTKKSWGTK
ncbi:glycosyltransferase family 2 protein [Polynucleobacter sp. MWH-CaK5]|uniref:glycosyltransferase n=1 Tax=Polynucleobacter sp. MWH-CaK5 TaxID=2689107 RepID=UPI001BFE07E6|nr:glycosyltransferase family 2 protein [Polynucleobacter sp. MWH-CaK5]QWD88447.1 glycosyltransferase family 2 protein [Polynucleobacter sp. MWH-CaK5]